MGKKMEWMEACSEVERDFPGLFGGHMQLEVIDAEDIREFYTSEEWAEYFAGSVYVARLSAPGYTDSTDWTPLYEPNDLVEYCEMMEE